MNDVAERMDKYADRSVGWYACWEWTGARSGVGYGHLAIKRQMTTAHRIAYEMAYGPIPAGLVVRHRCDNRGCCNPNHLEIGTYRDNIHDAIKRGRFRFSLTADQAREVRDLYAAGDVSHRELGRRFGVERAVIRRALSSAGYDMAVAS